MTLREMAEQVTEALNFLAPVDIRVLLVDDSSDDCVLAKRHAEDAIKRALCPTNIRLECVTDFKQAKQEILKAEHDVYMIDWTLKKPGDGIQLIHDLVQEGSFGPFVVLSGMEDALRQESQERMLALNVMDFLSKDSLAKGGINRCCRYALKNHRLLQLARKAKAKSDTLPAETSTTKTNKK